MFILEKGTRDTWRGARRVTGKSRTAVFLYHTKRIESQGRGEGRRHCSWERSPVGGQVKGPRDNPENIQKGESRGRAPVEDPAESRGR